VPFTPEPPSGDMASFVPWPSSWAWCSFSICEPPPPAHPATKKIAGSTTTHRRIICIRRMRGKIPSEQGRCIVRTSENTCSEAVWKVVLGGYFATLAGMRKAYTTDLSDAEWNYIEPHMPAPKGHGRPRIHDLREILNAVFYALRSGCQWRLLPHDFPLWPTVYWYFRKWRLEGALGSASIEPSEKTPTSSPKARSQAQRRRGRFPVAQEYRGGRRRTRLRRSQEGQGP
jgi:hypothetical protein